MGNNGTDWLDARKCKVCGKQFSVLYPHLWAYKRGYACHYDYFCSWSCLRKSDRKGKDNMKNNDQLEIARELAEAMERGEDPKEFLKSKGYTNPNKAYTNIKAKCADKDPELARHGMPIQDIAYILGHEKIDTTMRYVVRDKETIRSDIRRFA